MRWRSLNKVLSGALAIAVALSSGLMTAVGGIAQVSAADDEVNWALGKPYTSSLPDNYYHSNNDPDLTKFADGVYGTSWDVNTVGFYAGPTEGPATFEFTLGEQNYPITRVVVSGFAYAGAGIGTCDVQVEYQSSDMLGTDEWLTAVTLPASGVDDAPYDVSANVEIGAAKVRFIVSGTNTWTFLDEIEMWGPNADYLAEAPVIDTDLNCEALIPTGKDATFSVDAHSVDGGELTYQWYKDGAPLEGEVSSSLTITGATAADAGQYYLKVTNNKGTYHESTNSRNIDIFVRDVSEQNLLYGIPFTTSMTYGNPGNFTDNGAGYPSFTLLTDGLRQEDGSTSGNRVGRYNGSVGGLSFADFVFDLGSVKSFEQLNVSTVSGSNGVVPVTRVRLSVSDTGNGEDWKLVFDGSLNSSATVKEYVFATQGGVKISGQYIKVDVYSIEGNNYVGLDEIELWETATGEEPDAILGGGEQPEDTDNLLSWNKSYTANKTSADDASNTALTNGTMGSLLGTGWVSYPASSGNLEFVVDLGAESAFQQVELHFLKDEALQAVWPQWVQVEYSTDQSSWTTMSRQNLDQPMETPIYTFQAISQSSLNGRYIKVTIPNDQNVYLDEIQVLKDRTVISTDPEEEDVDPNNLAYGCSYTPVYPANSSYPDQGGTELTDGRRAVVNYQDPKWTGFLSWDGDALDIDDFYITVDLGSVKSFEQVKTGVLRHKGAGILNPPHIKVEYSTDNEHWTVLSDEDTNFGDDEQVNRYIATADEPVSAQYVRIHYTYDGWVFVDEIEVLATADPNEDANVNPDNGREINLVRGSSYTISRTPDVGAEPAGKLTDGLYGSTYTSYDPNWVGFEYSSNNHVEIEFDLYSPVSISQILVSSRYDSDKNLTIPNNMAIWVQNGQGNWDQIKSFPNTLPSSSSNVELTWDSAVDSVQLVEAGTTKIYSSKVRIEFDIPENGMVYLDEIKIIGKLGKCSDASEVVHKDESGAYNLALLKPYIEYPENVAGSQYEDWSDSKLTDGVFGSGGYNDASWVGSHSGDNGSTDSRGAHAIKTRVVDLGAVSTISSIYFNSLIDSSSGINGPLSTTIMVSVDGERWLPLARHSVGSRNTPSGIHTYGWHVPDGFNTVSTIELIDDEMIAARYVRVDIQQNAWSFVDEIVVNGYDGQLEGVRLADFGDVIGLESKDYGTAEQAGGVRDMLLCYNQWQGYDSSSGQNSWLEPHYDVNRLRYLLTYVNDENQAVDTMYDTVLFLALGSQYGNEYITGDTKILAGDKDWYWYLDTLFREGGDVETLNEAARNASIELGDPDYKVNMVIMFPTPFVYQKVEGKEFGSLDGHDMGNFLEWEQCTFAIDWWIDQVLTKLDEVDHDYIDFKGFYWLDENSDYEEEMIYFNDRVHEEGYYTYWIPYWGTTAALYGHDYGFDGISYQPNHMFYSAYIEGGMGELVGDGNPLFEEFSRRIGYGNIGAEMECDGRELNGIADYNKFLDYLNSAAVYGYDGPEYHRAWYYADPIISMATSGEPLFRQLYTNCYEMMKGIYTPREYHTGDFPSDPAIGEFPGNSSSVYPGGSTGGGSGSGGGGGYYPNDPDEPDEPSTPEEPTAPSGDDNYTWEEVDGDYQLTDADGEVVTGWAQVAGKWYYLNDNGYRTVGWLQVDGTWYYLNADGTRATGWLKLKNTWYYLNADGEMQTGWLKDGGVWYYLYNWGGMANTSWVKVNGTWYYFRGNGHMMTGWLQLGSTWYYLKSNGAMATGWQKVGNTWYYLKSNGAMAKGWLQLENTWYYLKSSGAMATGWNWVGNKCYYFYSSGKMAANTTVGGYKVDASGAWVQ